MPISTIGRVLAHRIYAKISPKAASEKAQTAMSENKYTNPIIDVFRTRAEYLRRSLVIVCREHGQWQASFIRGCRHALRRLVWRSRFYGNFQIPRNPGKTEHAQTVCTRLFSPHPHMSLGMRLSLILSLVDMSDLQRGDNWEWQLHFSAVWYSTSKIIVKAIMFIALFMCWCVGCHEN